MVERGQFGGSEVGQAAYELILQGEGCAAIIGGERCGKQARLTVEFDVLGNPESLGACSNFHAQVIQNQISSDLALYNKWTWFGNNGRGREKSNS
ncbi:hypothetical protein HY357_00230 [Candidatus Roizmanbacteria bacterium]|nr:hypothetical protein [Candidatus Roizmanbacteria bacterium]